MRWWALVALAGCGRFAFDESGDAVSAIDAQPVCGTASVPSTITIAGTTFRYTNFLNARATLDTALVQARDRDSNVLAATMSDATGAYTLTVSPADVASLHYARSNYENTRIFYDRPFTSDVQGAYMPVWTPGDGPLWTAGAVNSVYDAAMTGYMRDATRGTVNVAVRDCAGAPLEGVQVTFDPPPDLMTYQASDGTPDMALTATTGPFAHALALNVPAGMVHITASAPGMRFTDVTVRVESATSTIAIVHGGP